jgi:hypothetical protein
MVASEFKLIFLIILSLQLSAILSKQIDANNGMSMTLHTRRSLQGISVEEPLYHPGDFIEYYIKLSIGTPAQDVLLVMDTGSEVVWAPCTSNYTCTNCLGYSTVFLPSNSSSALPVQCADPKCKDVCGEGTCGSIENCSGTCPDYALFYGSGNTTGHLLTDTLTLPSGGGEIENFGFGCSGVSFGFAGIAGFGRGNVSLPSQLSPLIGDKFAYCLNDQNNSSMILLGDMAVPTNITLNYTTFLNKSGSPSSFPGYNDLYCIGLQAVSIGGNLLTLPSNISTFDSNGKGGTIIDSGTSFTTFPGAIYNQIASEFASQIAYPRAPEIEATTLFGLCYNVSGVANANIQFPEFAFHFNGGSDMVLPQDNCFALAISLDYYCLTLVNGGTALDNSGGNAAILGNYQQKNFYILYDREMNRLDFTQQAC